MAKPEEEKAKYEKAWSHDAYRGYAPGEDAIHTYIAECRPKRTSIIDFGAGTGRAALSLYNLGFDVTMIDIADNCLDASVRDKIGHKLLIANLWDKIELPSADEGYCTDVMEHIPPEHVDAVVENITGLCSRSFFQICLHEDHFGKVIDEHLHLTIRPYEWWLAKLSEYGEVLSSGDMGTDAWYYLT